MKKLLLALIALCLIVLASSYWFGLRTEGLMQAALERVTSNAPFLKITLKEKHRGIFSSTYTYSMASAPGTGADAPGNALVASLTTRVAHGPIPFAAGDFAPCQALADSVLAVDPASGQEFKKFNEQFPELSRSTIRTRFAFDGSGVTDIAIPAFKKTISGENGEPVDLDWQGLTSRTTFNDGFTAYVTTIQAPLLHVRSKQVDVTLAGISGDYDMKKTGGKIWTGKQRSMIKSLTVLPETGGQPTRIDSLSLAADITPRAEVLDYLLEASGALALAGKPPLPVRLSFTLRDLDQAALGEFYDLVRRPAATPGESPLTEADGQRLLKTLLGRSPSLALVLEAKEGGSPLTLNAEVRCQGMKELPAELTQALSMLRAQAGFEGSAKATADLACRFQEAAGQDGGTDCGPTISAQLDQFAQQGFVVLSGDKLSSKATWDGKELMVNGNKMF